MPTKKLVRMSSKGQIVLPKKFRDKLGLQEGDYLMVDELVDGVLVLGKSRRSLFDAISEPIRREAEEQGLSPEQLMDMIKDMRRQRESDAA